MGGTFAYDRGTALLTRGDVDWEHDDVRVMLLGWGYLPDQENHLYVADVARYEVAPSGTYTRGGTPLEGRWRLDNGPDIDVGATGTVEYADFTGKFRFAVVYRASDGALLVYADHGKQQVTRGQVVVEFKDGIFSARMSEDQWELERAQRRAERKRRAVTELLN